MTARINLDDLERLHREATPGPWERVQLSPEGLTWLGVTQGDNGYKYRHHIFSRTMRERDENALAAARNALPHLLAVARAALAHREAQLDAHHERTDDYSPQMDAANLRERETWHTLQAALAPFRAGEEKGE